MTSSGPSLFRREDGRNLVFTFILVSSLFLLWGFCNGMIDATDKHFQEELHLTLAQSAWVQFAHYLGYFLMSLPAGWLATRLGYKAKQASAFILMAVMGGALLPKLDGVGNRSLRHVEGLRRPHGLLRLGGRLCLELAAPEQDRIFGPPRRHRWAWPVDQVEDEPWSNSI